MVQSPSEALAKKFGPALKGILKQIDNPNDDDRARLLAQAQRNDLYYRGLTRVVPGIDDSGYLSWSKGESDDDITRRSVNKFHGDGKKFVSVLGQKIPNLKALPKNPRSERHVAAAKEADDIAVALLREWNADEMNMRLARGLWVNGTQFSYVRPVSDGDKYGFVEEPVIERGSVVIEPESYQCLSCGHVWGTRTAGCPECGSPYPPKITPAVKADVPIKSGVERYAKTRIECSLHNVSSVTVPHYAEDIDDCEWLIFRREVTNSRLIAAFPHLRDVITKKPAGQQDAAADTRAQLASPSGQKKTAKHTSTVTIAWFLPSFLYLINDEDVRAEALEQFKAGVKFLIVGDEVVSVEAEKLQARWMSCPTETADTIYTDPIGSDMIDAQDALDDSITISMEILLRGLPITIVSSSIINSDALADKPAYPAEILIAPPSAGNDLSKGIATIPTARFPEQLSPFVSMLQSEAREVTGIMPQIFGGGDGSMTASEYSRRHTQALAQLGMQWLYMRKFWVGTIKNGIDCVVELGLSDVIGTDSEEGTGINFKAIASGDFRLEADEAIPQSWGQQKEQLIWLMGQAPEVVASLGVTNPVNISAVRELLGIQMLVSPGDEMRDKVKSVISELLKSAPIQNPETGDVEPTIHVDQFEDDPVVVVEVVKQWLRSKEGLTEAKSNLQGVENVRAYGMEAVALAAPPPPPQEQAPQQPPPQQQQ